MVGPHIPEDMRPFAAPEHTDASDPSSLPRRRRRSRQKALAGIVIRLALLVVSAYTKPPTESQDYLTEAKIAGLPALTAAMTPRRCPAHMMTYTVDDAVAPTWFGLGAPDERITLLPGDVLSFEGSIGDPPPAISRGSPLCQLGSSQRMTTTYAVTKPGKAFVYFAGPYQQMTVEQFVIIKRTTAKELRVGNYAFAFGLDWLRFGFQTLVILFIAAYGARAVMSTMPEDLRRADDAQREPYDPERIRDAAFNSFDAF